MTNLDLLLVFTQAPLQGAANKEGLDLALALGSFGQQVGIAFVGAGVLMLQQGQQPEVLELKGTHKLLAALSLYGIENLFVEQEALNTYGLQTANLIIPTQSCSAASLASLKSMAKQVLVF